MKEVIGPILPGYAVYEYQLVLAPHEELREKIASVRKDFGTKYNVAAVGKSRPHLLLARFVQYELMEERIVNHLKTIAMGFKPFKVELKDFGSFPTHSIYINVISKVPIQSLVKQVRTNTQRLMKLNNDNKPHFILEPQMIIAGKLLPWQYEKGWLEYSNKHFTGRFMADGMLLLKRLVGTRQYAIVQRFNFEHMPVNITQGELFGGALS